MIVILIEKYFRKMKNQLWIEIKYLINNKLKVVFNC